VALQCIFLGNRRGRGPYKILLKKIKVQLQPREQLEQKRSKRTEQHRKGTTSRNNENEPKALINYVAPGFKNKTRYTLYVSPGSQISNIGTNKDNIK
jgi:hypothetical protein